MSDRQSTSCCSESLDSERHRSRIVQNIQRLACHVSKSVLTYVREEVIWHHHSVSSHDVIDKDITLYPPTHGDTGYDGEDNFGSVDTAAFDDTSACSDISENTHGNDTKVTEVCDAQEKKRRICASLTLKLEKNSNERSALKLLKPNLATSTLNPMDPTRQHSKQFPYTCRYDAALLFVDISGFTRLSTLLNPEDLSSIINDYFETIVDEVSKRGGDIIKFAGDAIYAEWRIPQDLLLASKETALEYCVTAAALCGSIIVAKCSGFPISVKEENIDLTLNLHCGLSYGKIVSIHLGDDLLRREHLILGDVIEKASKAANSAGIGELVCCPKSMLILLRTCGFDKSFDKTKECKDAIIIARLSRCFFTPSQRHIQQIESTIGKYEPLTHVVLRLLNDMDIDELIRFNRLLSLYVHPVIAKNYAAETHFEGKLMLMGESKIEEAELRDVFVMFITPLIKVSLTGTDENNDLEIFTKLNAIMNLVTKEVSRLEGQIRQFIMDDKGLVLIATFGLRGSTFHNLVAERALPTALKIHDCLASELDVQSKIGATMGNAYCGLIGSTLRHEYAVLGPSVNLAARLMAYAKNPGVLVNSQIRMMADRTYGFNALTPIYAKGYADLVAIFEPLTPLRRRWGHMKPNFVGRTTEVQDLVEIACNMAENPSETQTKLVLVSGVAGIGKSAFTLHVIDQIKSKLCPTSKKLFISKYAIRDSDAFTPFGAFALIILDAVSANAEASEDISISNFDCSNKSITSSCAGSTSTKSNGRLAERVVNLCHELGATRESAHFIGQHLLRMNIQSYQREYSSSAKTSLVQLLSKAFISCTNDADFILIALDDVHLADEMSFKLIEELYTTTSNILFICSSRPHPTYDLKIDASFWNVLNSEYFHQKRFIPLQLNPISSSEMKKLISHALGVNVEEVNDRVHRTVFAQSKGIPQFAHILLEQVAKTSVPSDGDSLKDLEKLAALSESSAGSPVSQIILWRIDEFDSTMRKVLNTAATVGSSFDLDIIVGAIMMLNTEDNVDENAIRSIILKALLSIAEAGVLYVEYNGREDLDHLSHGQGAFSKVTSKSAKSSDFEDVEFFFSNEIWRESILELMLDQHKKTIHRAIATALEALHNEEVDDDYRIQLKIFHHWKSGGNFVKASETALRTGKIFDSLGLHKQNVSLFEGTLRMCATSHDFSGGSEYMSADAIQSMTVDDVKAYVSVSISLGKALTNLHQSVQAANVFQCALMLLEESKAGQEIPDRTILFPIFSGLFILIKMGVIDQDDDCSYELSLVKRFVSETQRHGDPIHYARALAMEADTHARLNNFELALESHQSLRKVYEAECHTNKICNAYGSDRAAQCISLSALWQYELGYREESLSTCDFVLDSLMPMMEATNVHNSCVILFPVIWILKDCGMALKARDVFSKYVVSAFKKYFKDGATTFALNLFEPILILLDLYGNPCIEPWKMKEYLDWALCSSLYFGDVLNNAFLIYGCAVDSISAEICLLLSQRSNESQSIKKQLVESGIKVSHDALQRCKRTKSHICLRRATLILNQLECIWRDIDTLETREF